jgi:hypothetical protein
MSLSRSCIACHVSSSKVRCLPTVSESLNISNREIHDKRALVALPAIAFDAANEVIPTALNLDE